MSYELHQGDCLSVLRTLDAGIVQTCVTSPPYFGLRDYGTARWEGGDSECDHRFRDDRRDETSTLVGTSNKEGFALNHYKDICARCGAIRIDNQIGLEDTPEAYVEKLVQVFREVRRVLKDDGCIWINLGDSYNGSGKGGVFTDASAKQATNRGANIDRPMRVDGLKSKDLIGIPWMVAFALRADGWYLRQDIIWAKPNPMPESVTDRCTKSHEYMFLLSKSAQYYCNMEAIAETVTDSTLARLTQPTLEHQAGSSRVPGKTNGNMKAVGSAYSFKRKVNESPKPGEPIQHREDREDIEYRGKRNKRSVWTVATQPYKAAHFATFPPKLIEPCILAGSREGDIVLDPFNGSGTTGAVAIKHHRRYVGIELNPDYLTLTRKRFEGIQPVLFPAQVAE